ncbi:hypothetical protein HBI37_212610 [Parastagonospora nodorum]|nr:hypothetical protein HBI68_021260 [Parastagonospora nodorum]KAH6326242.1 hypothetical protein HBI37_212610 [Parastagonospora nodorum]
MSSRCFERSTMACLSLLSRTTTTSVKFCSLFFRIGANKLGLSSRSDSCSDATHGVKMKPGDALDLCDCARLEERKRRVEATDGRLRTFQVTCGRSHKAIDQRPR